LRIEAEILVFWLASGNLPTYEIIVNGACPSKEAEEEVEECLKGQDWWDEIQKIRGNRGSNPAPDAISDLASIFNAGSHWPEASFQQGPRGERVQRFLGLRKLLRKSKRRHTMSGITKLGVSLGMRTHRLSDDVVNAHATTASASEDSGSDFDDLSDSAIDSPSDKESAASEGDMDDFTSESDTQLPNKGPIKRRRSHGDTMRGPPISKRSTGEQEIRIPERRPRKTEVASGASSTNSGTDTASKGSKSPSKKRPDIMSLTPFLDPNKAEASSSSKPASPTTPRPSIERPTLSRHASKPKFSSRPVPMTRVATEDGPGPSIMFTDTPSPPPRRNRLPSAYLLNPNSTTSSVHIPESPPTNHPRSSSPSRNSTYSTQALPISFNDLPCRAQHLILNELMRQQSSETAVMFTTLPSPVEGTCESQEASEGYLGDLEVLCKGCPPVLMVHSNSMTVTMSL